MCFLALNIYCDLNPLQTMCNLYIRPIAKDNGRIVGFFYRSNKYLTTSAVLSLMCQMKQICSIAASYELKLPNPHFTALTFAGELFFILQPPFIIEEKLQNSRCSIATCMMSTRRDLFFNSNDH